MSVPLSPEATIPSLAGAVETAPVSSLHSIGSANPDDFAVPTGREEEWRFTPLNRLRKLHADAPFGSSGVTVAVEAAPELVVEKEDLTERKRPAATSRWSGGGDALGAGSAGNGDRADPGEGAAGPDAALRVLEVDPDSRFPERRAVLTRHRIHP